MTAALMMLGLVVVSLAAYVGGRQILGDDPGSAELDQRVEALHRQVVAWRAAQDHEVTMLDRRLRDIEGVAARAGDETRFLSLQMADLTEGVGRRLEQVERRDEIERLAAAGPPRSGTDPTSTPARRS